MTVVAVPVTKYYVGVAADTKPTTGLLAGAEFVELDTGKRYRWTGDAWQQVPNLQTDGAGAQLFPNVAAPAAGLAYGSLTKVMALPMLDNGAALDPAHGTKELTVLASASRTAQTASADFTNVSARGIKLYLNVTAITGGPGTGIIPRLQGKDPVSGTYSSLSAAPTAVAATGLLVYSFYPSVFTAGFAAHNNQALERTWRVLMTVSDTTPYTYSVGACLLP